MEQIYPSDPRFSGYEPYEPQPPRVSRARNVLGLVGMIAGIVGLVFFWYPILGLANPIAGLILSSIGKKKYPPDFARVGWILSLIGLILSIIATIVWIIFYASILSSF